MTHSLKAYRLTTLSCFVGIFVQAIVTNITAVLFIPFMTLYDLSYVHLGILVGINFTAQVTADIIFSGIIDRVGFRKLVLPATICAFLGLLLFALSPYLFSNILVGMGISTVIFSVGSGLLEILLSPIIQAIPNENKGPAMTLMHSFYAWGQVATIIITTLSLAVFGIHRWQIIVIFWAFIPVIDFFLFSYSIFPLVIAEHHRLNMKDLLFKPFYIVALLAIFFGAGSELIMNQWASTFMDQALQIPKVTGDILGMSGFAIMLGLGRVLYARYGAKIDMNKVLVLSSMVVIFSYIVVALSPINGLNLFACALCGLGASLLWPGTLVISAQKYPLAGAWMFAILAAAGDIGGAVGPSITGVIVEKSIGMHRVIELALKLDITPEQLGIRIGILSATIFPIFALVCHYILTASGKKSPTSTLPCSC